jgi:aspartate-semialdehyde dehydrogenase
LTSRDARLALVGATGTIGSQIAELIGERALPYSELKLFAGESSGGVIEIGERSLPVANFSGAGDLAAFDIAFLAVQPKVAEKIIAADPGPVLIDLTSAAAAPRDGVEMVAPGLTAREHIMGTGGRIFAVPHPAAQLLATILQALKSDGFAAAALMQSASAAGQPGISELLQQSADLLNVRLHLDDEPQVAFNVYPVPDNREQARVLAAQIQVLGVDSSRLVLDVVRVPAFHGSALTLFVPPNEAQKEWATRLRSAPGLIVVESDSAAGFVDAVGQDAAITRMSADSAGAAIWCAFDAARIAALTALWIAETLGARRASA